MGHLEGGKILGIFIQNGPTMVHYIPTVWYVIRVPPLIYSLEQEQLDNMNLLVQSKVYGIERSNSASRQEVSQ